MELNLSMYPAIRGVGARFGLYSEELHDGVIMSSTDATTYLSLNNGCIRQLAPEDIATIEHQPTNYLPFDEQPVDRLDLRNCRHLKSLNLSHSNVVNVVCESDELRSIVIRDNNELTHLKCKNSANLELLDVSNCPWLEYLNANWCEGLNNLNIEGCHSLSIVKVRGTDLDELDLSRLNLAQVDVRDCDRLITVRVDLEHVSKVDHDDDLEVIGV